MILVYFHYLGRPFLWSRLCKGKLNPMTPRLRGSFLYVDNGCIFEIFLLIKIFRFSLTNLFFLLFFFLLFLIYLLFLDAQGLECYRQC